MAKPRVFISSTFYDLRQVRDDLESFIISLGYEPVRHESGNIPYGKEEALESYAYREVEICDIIITIIGGRFGTESSSRTGNSITQNELKRALEKGVQVFIFIDKNVLAEYSTYQLNKGNDSVKYSAVDNQKIFEFVEYLYKLPCNNAISTFERALDIIDYLKNQWAGLFQRYMQGERRIAEVQVLDEMKSVSKTLKEMVTFLMAERDNKDDALQSILLSNHPAFRRFAQLTETNYHVFFSDLTELNDWLSARGWKSNSNNLDSDSTFEWINGKAKGYIKLTENIFSASGQLKIYTNNDWSDDWVQFNEFHDLDSEISDDLPF